MNSVLLYLILDSTTPLKIFKDVGSMTFNMNFFLQSSLPSHLKDQIPPAVRDLGFNLSHAMTNALKEKIYQFDSFKLNQYCDHVNVGGWTICQQGHHYAPFENN